jgi:ribosomal protein S18 acetylase RimI-like enzyme
VSGRIAIIEPARPEDACGILDLLTDAFGASYLKFAVYQSARSVVFLAEQIEAALAASHPSFFLLRGGTGLEGFYSAVDRQGEFFLNYIATKASARGLGAGRLLLDHFESTGVARGCTSVGLDVFRSNGVAEAWYRRRDYVARGSRFRARFELAGFRGASGFRLELSPDALQQALAEEEDRGFSSVDCEFAGTFVRLGLIAGAVCNLMEPQGAEALAVAPLLATRFGGSRRWLLASGAQAFAGEPAPEAQEELLYMTRMIARSGRRREPS